MMFLKRKLKIMESKRKTRGYWTKEKCQEAASLCKIKKDFYKKYRGAYVSSIKNNWLNDICSHMKEIKKPNGYWNIKQNCLDESTKYKTKKEFRNGCGSAYNNSYKNGWLDEFFS
jgi:hypothetical protein